MKEKLKSALVESLQVKSLKIGSITVPESVLNTWILLIIVLVVCFLLTRNLKVENPGKRQIALESFVTWIQKTCRNMLGEGAAGYADYITTVIVFIAVTNLSAVFETEVTKNFTLFKPPTKDLNVCIALALMSIVIVEYAGIRHNRVGGWLKSFTHPVAIVTPLNVLEIAIKPLSLCMRLFGNVFGGFIIMELIRILVPVFVPPILSLYFDLFDGLIQAYVFVFLTSIYIGEAIDG